MVKMNEIKGCPVADGRSGCGHCGGYYLITTRDLSTMFHEFGGGIDPAKLCGPLAERIIAAMAEREQVARSNFPDIG